MSQRIYEIRDTTSDEVWFPLGYYLDFEIAKQEIDEHGPHDQISPHEVDEDSENIEIIAHDIGWGGDGKKVFALNRVTEYSEVFNEYLWKITKYWVHPDYAEGDS